MNAQTEEAKDRLVDDFRRVIHDAEALLKATANQTGDNIQAIRGRARQRPSCRICRRAWSIAPRQRIRPRMS
jgi:ElaB/YqjD/DUF883 family membrane-anchored ribosome-binding protein